MNISYEDYVKTQTNYEYKYFRVSSHELMDILGYDLLFFELYRFVATYRYELDLQIALKQIDGGKLVTIWIDDEFVKTLQSNTNNPCKMLYQIQQVELKKTGYYTHI
tara:strand:- start:18172 stop:18492 length:321 start_codon:yes stop_codon:yes gene_type:complete